MCLYPKLIKNRKFIANKKNGGVIPAVNDKRTLLVPVGCGKCMECKKQKSRQWQVRLQEEIKTNKDGKFVTLTFSNESIKKLSKEIEGLSGYDLDNEIATLAVRRFLERWRKKYKKSVRHWLVTELGGNGTENIHLHGLIFTKENGKTINEIWKYGYTDTKDETNGGYVSDRTINYIVKYVNKTDEKHKEYNSKVLTSQGMGKGYTESINAKRNKYDKENTKEEYITRDGTKLNMPIYYRNKIYSEEEREKLWIEKLNKKERWVGGEKIDISKGEEEYYKTLEYYRKKNKELGYGDDEKNWERKKYENDRRNAKLLERIKNGEKKENKIIIPQAVENETLPTVAYKELKNIF